jgi:hypothetical protein
MNCLDPRGAVHGVLQPRQAVSTQRGHLLQEQSRIHFLQAAPDSCKTLTLVQPERSSALRLGKHHATFFTGKVLGRSRVMVRLPASHQCVHTTRIALQA